MRAFTRGWGVLLGLGLLASAGCSEDNESFIMEQKSRVRAKLSGARGVQAETQAEFFASTPGVVGGAGTRIGPVPDQGAGYPGYPAGRR